MNRILLTLLTVLLMFPGIYAMEAGDSSATPSPQKEKTPIFTKPKFSGFAMASYQATFQESGNSNSFDIRLVRASIEGRILNDFYYKIQGQINGNTSTLGSSPRLVDYFMEWQKLEFFKIKLGQFKRPFTFENPMNPIDQGFMSYSQPVSKLSGFSDRSGEHACNGRDIGLQLQGDFLKNGSGRNLLHYQVGVFNGQGINVKDVDNKKDIIGGIWVMPISGMRIGAFGWEGSYARKSGSEVVSLNKHRYALSAEYKKDDLQLRAEYIHSTGQGFATTYQKTENASDVTIKTYTDKDGNEIANDKADGFYALAIVPILPGKLMAKARYDLYRPTATWGLSKTNYEVGLNYRFCKYLEVQTEYAFTNDRSLANHNYSSVFVQVSIRY
ncbi:MAG: porin [Muribaculaceae bacterium]|nr:porin [Muribaculaceae bacterium]